jgi:hopene-associated glycosyltransferase HpnB
VLAGLVAHAETERLALASLMVKLPTRTFWEKLLVPAFIFYFALLYPFRAVNDPASRIAGAAGGSLLVRRDALEAIGGIAAIKDAIIDDCALARAIKGSGRRIWLGLAERSRSLRRYRHLADFWSMVTRSAYPQLGYSPLRLVLALLGLGVAFLAPPLLLLAGGAAALVGLVAWGLMGWAYAPTVKYHGLSPLWAVTLPACRRAVCGHDHRLRHRPLPGPAGSVARPDGWRRRQQSFMTGEPMPRQGFAEAACNANYEPSRPHGGGGLLPPRCSRGSA